MADDIQSSFANAIALAEGYGADPNNLPTRTNNPGDIGNTGTGTQAFSSPDAGWAALDQQVGLMFSGQSAHYNPNMTIAQIGNIYANGDPNWATNVAGALGVPPNTTLNQLQSGSTPVTPLARNNPDNTTSYLTDDSDPAVAVPVSGMTISRDQIAGIMGAIAPPLVINSGLGQPGPLDDPSILQVNGPTSPIGSPVSFRVWYDAQQRLPITLTLNASISTFQKSMRHLVTRQRTRTGMLVDLWGMHPDQISGQASTGLMANQLGVTDFLSLSTVPTDVQKLVLKAYQTKDMVKSDVIESLLDSSEGFMRVAAKDAFVELLSVFKNNGTVWFQTQNYTGYTTGLQQQSPDVWSPQTGSTTFQNASRRNDVMQRGKVVMNFRNAAYYGYFKNLSWEMDAKRPFQWNFQFVFQVESTAVNVTLPSR